MVSDSGSIQIFPVGEGLLAGRFRAMASPCEVLADGIAWADMKDLTRAVAMEAWRVETKWSRYRHGNLVDRINTADGRPVEVDDETARLIGFGEKLHAISNRAFDLTAGLLRRAWRFGEGAKLPFAQAVMALMQNVGWHRVEWRAPVLRLQPGMEIDFGGLGKEYAVDRALAIASAMTDLPVMINFGGDLAATSSRRNGESWQVGIDSGIARRATPLIRLVQGAIATSGDGHRCLEVDGRRYGHILDARTGWPPPQAPRSVTVAATSCVEAGAYSTLAILRGPEAEAWLESQGVDASVERDCDEVRPAEGVECVT